MTDLEKYHDDTGIEERISDPVIPWWESKEKCEMFGLEEDFARMVPLKILVPKHFCDLYSKELGGLALAGCPVHYVGRKGEVGFGSPRKGEVGLGNLPQEHVGNVTKLEERTRRMVAKDEL